MPFEVVAEYFPSRRTTQLIVSILIWMVCSISMIYYNKWILYTLKFNFPVTLTLLQMTLTSTMLLLVFSIFGGDNPYERLTKESFWYFLFPVSALQCLGVVARNFTFLYLSVPAIQMLAAGAPAAIYLGSCLTGLEKFNVHISLSVAGACLGVCISSIGAIKMSVLGVSLQFLGIISEVSRAICIKFFFNKHGSTFDAWDLLCFSAPISTLLLFPFVFARDMSAIWRIVHLNDLHHTNLHFLMIVLLGNAVNAAALNLSAFNLLRCASALTASLSGIAKDFLIVALAHLFIAPVFGSLEGSGWIIAMICICIYVYLRHQQDPAVTKAKFSKIGPDTSSSQ